jgi:hypothetical protein
LCLFPAAKEGCITEKQVPGHFQAWKKDLRMKGFGKLAAEWKAQHAVTFHLADGGAIGVVIIIPVRALLFLVGTSWTILFLFIIQHIHDDLHLV